MNSLVRRGAAPHRPTRRQFLAQSAAGAWVATLKPFALRASGARIPVQTPAFRTDHAGLQSKYDDAVRWLHGNVVKVFGFGQPVLIEGDGYPGIWLECGPQEGLVYGALDLDAARANHEVFFDLQREDGYLPCWVHRDQMGSAQIQMVVPIAATAYELSEQIHEEAFLAKAYAACSRWDAWLGRYRNTRGTGLCEAFCGFDTGHDNSPRFKDLPWKCPNNDARVCPRAPGLPFLAPDLSATVFGGRVALAKMARALGRTAEAERWEERAEAIRKAILAHCFDPQDECFYDVDASNRFLRLKGDALTRVLGEHVVDQKLFGRIYARHLHNPQEFWAPYPFPSIALNDPAFDRALPENSWGGASQALTALRAPRWMEYYGRSAALADLMGCWVKALLASDGFKQQLNPWTGESSTGYQYSPAMLVLFDFVGRLYGVRVGADTVEWNCRLPQGAKSVDYSVPSPRGWARLHTTAAGTELRLGDRLVAQVEGTARLTTRLDGHTLSLVGTNAQASFVRVQSPDGRRLEVSLPPDAMRAMPQ